MPDSAARLSASALPAPDPFRVLLDEVGAYVYTTDLQGRYTYANRLVLDFLGVRELPDILGRQFEDIMGLDEQARAALQAADARVLQEGQTLAHEESFPAPASDEPRTYWVVKKPLRDAAGSITGMIGISHDITDKKRLESQVSRQNILLDAVLNSIDALVYMKGADRRFIYANQHVARVFGQSVHNIAGRRDTDFLPPDIAERFWEVDRQILASGQRQTSETTLADASGQLRHYWSTIVPCTAPDGTAAIIGVSTDITELHELKEELRQRADHDSLTGLVNRRRFWEQAERELALSRRHGIALALLAIDIDHFKAINDTHGHLMGDQVLRAFADTCRQALRSTDLCARTGGEEFCVLLPATDLDGARTMAERIRDRIAILCLALCADAGTAAELRISASFGLACASERTPTFDALFSHADQALYAAKRAGRNRVAVWEELQRLPSD